MIRDRLYRSRVDRVISGVAGGVAEWLDIDPSLVRIAFVLTALAG
ncbi:MAG: PspC domain-containing protein, partial [Chloroflexota bacterium]